MRYGLAVLIVALTFGAACAQTIEGKRIVAGHGHAMVTTHLFKTHIKEMQRAPLDGMLICVNRNDFAGTDKLREIRPHNWFTDTPVTIDDYSIALKELADTDPGRFRHNILWTSGTRRMNGNWFDDDWWKNIACNNAKVMAEVYKRGNFVAVWADVETGGAVPGAPLTWKNSWMDGKHSFEACAAKARQRGREWMTAFTSVAPDFKLILSHSYGLVEILLAGRGREGLSEINYGLLPAFIDGLLEGCGERGQVIDSGETTYGTMTYAGYMAWRKWDQLSAEELSQVPHLLNRNYRHATALWIDFEARSQGWHDDDLDKNHFSPQRMRQALYNAMAASDEFVWTYAINAHWWPNRAPVPSFDANYRPTPATRKLLLPDAYMSEVAKVREPHDLSWHPGRTHETGYEAPDFDSDAAIKALDDQYQQVADLSDGWLFHPADSSTTSALSWGIPLYTYGPNIEKAYDFQPIKLGDYWENQGVKLDGTGVYRRKFVVPEASRGKRLYLAVGPATGRTTMYIAKVGSRGKAVGRFQGDSVTVLDVTDAIDPDGDNYLSLVVASPAGPGGVYGTLQLLANEKGNEGYVELRGAETGKWFHWIRTAQLGNFDQLARENTVEARVRIPDEKPLTAELFATTDDGGFHIQFQPTGLRFRNKWRNHDATGWHTYRVVTARQGDGYRQTLFIDGNEIAGENTTPMKIDPDKPRHPALGFGIGWGYDSTPPVRMDVDYLRWANRPFTPTDEQVAMKDAPEADRRKDMFWDGAYEGDTTPEAEDWKWWYDNNPRPHSRINYFERQFSIDDPSKLTTVYDWVSGRGGKMIPRDVPRLDVKDETHGKIEPTNEGGYNAKLVLHSAKAIKWSWPALALTELGVTDFSPYAAVAVKLHNPTDHPQEVGFCVRDSDRSVWWKLDTWAPGETKLLAAPLDKVQQRVLISDIWTITLFTRNTDRPLTFLASPLYLIRD